MNNDQICVCMFSNLYPPVVSGSSVQVASLSRELARRGHQVVVITSNLDGREEPHQVAEGVHVYRLPAVRLPVMPISLRFPWLNLTLTPSNQRRIRSIVEHHQPDVLHLHNHMFDLALSASSVARRIGTPLVTTIHTVIDHPIRVYNFLLHPADRLLLKRLVINRTDIVICPDLTIRGYVQDAFGHPNTALVPYGLSLPSAPEKGAVERMRERFHLDYDHIILSLGHLHEIRNRRDLVRAMPFVLESHPRTALVIVGDVGTRTTGELARELGVGNSVVFTGAVPHSEVPAFMELADLEAHWFEESNPQSKTLGIAALEAMGAGIAVLATADKDVYGRGVLRHGENVVLVQPGKPRELAHTIVELLNDPARRRAIGDRARATVQKHFSWEGVCNETLLVYGDAARRGR